MESQAENDLLILKGLRLNRTTGDLTLLKDSKQSKLKVYDRAEASALNTIAGAIQNLFKWSVPLEKDNKSRSFESLRTPCHELKAFARSDTMDKRRSSEIISTKAVNSPTNPCSMKENLPELGSKRSSKDVTVSFSKREFSPGPGFAVADGSSLSDLNESPVKPNGSEKQSRKSTDSSDSCEIHVDLGEKTFEKSLNQILDKYTKDSKLEESKNRKRKSIPWYMMLSTTYKSRSEEFKKLFKNIPKEERLIVEYSCALQKEILVHGRMFITQNFICFYANIFRWETIVTIQTKEIESITKEKTARVIPNAIQINTEKEKFFFTSFATRDKTYTMIFKLWQNVLNRQSASATEIWEWIHSAYGEELGLTSSDDDYVGSINFSDCKDGGSRDSSIISKGDSSELSPTSDSPDVKNVSEIASTQVLDVSPDVSTVTIPIVPKEDIILTDCSDTTEEDVSEGEVVCSEHDHFDKLAHNEVYHLPVNKLFELLFTDSDFFRNFTAARKITEVKISDWTDDPDENSERTRELTYTMPLNAHFGPKSSHTIEKNICYKENKPGLTYVIDAECSPTGIPYGDSFYVANRYCLTRVTKHKSRLKVTSEVKYRKSVWGMVKNMIERNSVQGVMEYFQCLGVHLRKESDKNEKLHDQPITSKRKLRKRRSYTLRNTGNSSDLHSLSLSRQLPKSQTHILEKLTAPPTPVKIAQGTLKEETRPSLNADTLIRIVCIILLLLVMFNALLFYKLWSLETMANALYYPNSEDAIDSFAKQPLKSHEEWVQLLNQQQNLHNAEMQKWQDLLGVSITVVDQMKQTLVNLKEHIDRSDLKIVMEKDDT